MRDLDQFDDEATRMVGHNITGVLIAQRFRSDARELEKLEQEMETRVKRFAEVLASCREISRQRAAEIQELKQPCPSCGHVRQAGYSAES
jgi:hypothetical protein